MLPQQIIFGRFTQQGSGRPLQRFFTVAACEADLGPRVQLGRLTRGQLQGPLNQCGSLVQAP
jgi:hypothetical protein